MTADGVDTDAVQAHPELRSADDVEALRAAAAADRVVVTEDIITTFPAAVAPGTRPPWSRVLPPCPLAKLGLYTLGNALVALAKDARRDSASIPQCGDWSVPITDSPGRNLPYWSNTTTGPCAASDRENRRLPEGPVLMALTLRHVPAHD
jgi:hypothetical protein